MNVGDKINYLTLIEPSYMKPTSKKSVRTGKFKCDCGTEKEIRVQAVKSQVTKSCGCYNRKSASKRMSKMNEGGHGKLDHPLYQCWKSMKIRGDYIKEWSKFQKFYDWSINFWKDGLVLSRKDDTKKFSKTNSIFITKKEATKNNFDIEKARKTCLEKYGVDHPNKVPEILEKSLKTKEEKYGRAFLINSNAGIQEQEIRIFLEESGYKFPSNRSVLGTKELDMFNHELHLAVEFCGLYWHNELSKNPKDKKYHQDKHKRCLDQNIRLITIFADEWEFRQEQVKGYLNSVLGLYNNKIFARKTICQKIDKNSGIDFINKYHIQGQKKKAKVYYGLMFDGTLIGVMSLSAHHRVSSKLVLDRLCFSKGVQVIGGASKLLKNCVSWAKNEGYNSILSWSDNRWSSGNVYEKMGFLLDDEIGPDYSYVKSSSPKKRIPKQSMTKSKIGCPKNKTEKEYTQELGFARIWDCGKKRWKLYI